MPGIPPRRPTGTGNEARYAKFFYDQQTRESRLGQVSGHRVINSTSGKIIVPSKSRRGGASVSVQQFKLRFVEDDYLVCRDWDGTTIGADDVYVLKPFKLRCSATSADVYGETHDYTYEPDDSEPFMEYGTTVPDSDPEVNEWGETEAQYDTTLFEKVLNTVRTVDPEGIVENQRVVPVWLKGDIIDAIEIDYGGETTEGIITPAGQSIEFLMIGEARMWARI